MITCLVAVANFQVCLCRDHEVTFTNYKTKVAGCFCKASIRSHRTTCLTTPNPQPSTRLSALQLAKAKYQTLERISSVQELIRDCECHASSRVVPLLCLHARSHVFVFPQSLLMHRFPRASTHSSKPFCSEQARNIPWRFTTQWAVWSV